MEETRGVQPWRRLFHAMNGCLVVLAVGPLGVSARGVAAALALLLALLLAVDGVRLRLPRLNVLFFRWFRLLASPREARGVASSTWYVAGIALTLFLLPRDPALVGILVLALADPAASYLGRRFGRVPLGKGTVEGALAFFSVALVASLFVVPVYVALCVSAVTTAVEVISWPVDDNFSIPLVASTVAYLVPVL